VRMQISMTVAPGVEIPRPVRLDAGRTEKRVLPLVPVLRGRVDQVDREFVDDEERSERGDEVEPLPEWTHVVQHPSRDHGVPAPS
jgi:hypothetical protein